MAADTAPEIDDDLPGNPEPKKPSAETKKPSPETKRPATETPEPEPEPKKHRHSSRLMRLAEDYGFTQDDLDNHPSEVIWEEIHRLQQLEAARKSAPQPETQKAEPEVDEDEQYLAELKEVDPKLEKIIRRAMSRDDLKPINEKLAKLDALEKAEQARQARTANDLLDAAFEALGEKFEPLVGKGSISEINPGEQGWRGAIYAKAKIDHASDSPSRINAKIKAAALALAGDRVKEKETEAPNAYEAAAQSDKRSQPSRDTNGRFTAADFERGHVHRPNGKQTGLDQLDAVEATRRYLREHGDPRGDRASIEFDEDLPA